MKDIDELRLLIANRLSIARKQSGLSQAQVATKLNIPRPSISEIEAGRRRVSAEELIQFADLYHIDIKWITGEKKENEGILNDQLQLAAREVANLKPEDLEKVISLLNSLRPKE